LGRRLCTHPQFEYIHQLDHAWSEQLLWSHGGTRGLLGGTCPLDLLNLAFPLDIFNVPSVDSWNVLMFRLEDAEFAEAW